MNEILTLNDGTVIENVQTFGAVVGLWIHIRGTTLASAYNIFSKPHKTVMMRVTAPGTPEYTVIYEGFTILKMVMLDDSGEVIVQMQKVS